MEKTKAKPAASKQGKEVLVNVVLDRSGSMSSCQKETVSGFNEYLNGLRADKETQYNISLIQFDAPNEGPELTVTHLDKPLKDVPDITDKDYQPRGRTPLFDAIGECVRRVDAKGRAVTTVIITDGIENASKEFSQAHIKDLIAAKEKEGWGFVFLGANIDSAAVGGSIGVAPQNAINYSTANTHKLYANLASATAMRSSNIRTYGAQASACMSFFDDNQKQQVSAPSTTTATTFPIPNTTGGRPAAPPPFRPTWTVRQ
jgi:Mg-chelatase subunit ChlD